MSFESTLFVNKELKKMDNQQDLGKIDLFVDLLSLVNIKTGCFKT